MFHDFLLNYTFGNIRTTSINTIVFCRTRNSTWSILYQYGYILYCTSSYCTCTKYFYRLPYVLYRRTNYMRCTIFCTMSVYFCTIDFKLPFLIFVPACDRTISIPRALTKQSLQLCEIYLNTYKASPPVYLHKYNQIICAQICHQCTCYIAVLFNQQHYRSCNRW